MQEKSKNMDLEVVPLDTNEAVPAPEMEHKKKKKSWTLFRSNKSKSEENAKKEIFSEGESTNVKIISVKPKNVNEDVKEEEGTKDEKENSEELQVNEDKKNESSGDAPNDVEIQNVELPIDDSKQPEEHAVPKKRWYHWFSRRSQKKEVTPETETINAILAEENKAPLAEEEPSKVTEFDEIEVIEVVTPPPELDDKGPDEATVVDTSEPEKRKRLTLSFFRRSSKKNKKVEKISPTETIIEEIEVKMPMTDKPEDDVEATEVSKDDKTDKPEIIEAEALPVIEDVIKDEVEALPISDDAKEVVKDVPVAVEEKRKRFTFKNFFRRSTKKDEKLPEATPTEDAEKVAEINENGPETEKTEEMAETVKEVPSDEPKNECPSKSDDQSDIKDVNDDKLPTDEITCAEKLEFPIGDTANVDNVQNVDEPKNDDKLQNDEFVEKSINLIVEASMNEVEQK